MSTNTATRNDLLCNDFVIDEENCNLACTYCLTGQSNFKTRHAERRIFDPPHRSSYRDSEQGRRIDRSLAEVESRTRLPILKITGGEIFLLDHVMDLLRDVSRRYATVVIQTNGVLLDERKLEEIRSWGNACLQLSLDAVSFEGNSYRTATRSIHERVMRTIDAALRTRIPTEIYAVLNDRSIPCLGELLEYMRPYAEWTVVCPFPVRGPDRSKFNVRPDQAAIVGGIVERYEDFRDVLPPLAYMKRLDRFLREGGRTFRCHLPRFAFTTFDDGTVTPCPNIWFASLGNVLSADPGSAIHAIGRKAFYSLLLEERPRLDACKACFTPWDMLSMYLDGEITIDELCRTPMYSAPETRKRILEIASLACVAPR